MITEHDAESLRYIAALRECARLLAVIYERYPGLLAVMWENDYRRQLPYMREKVGKALAQVNGKQVTK